MVVYVLLRIGQAWVIAFQMLNGPHDLEPGFKWLVLYFLRLLWTFEYWTLPLGAHCALRLAFLAWLVSTLVLLL